MGKDVMQVKENIKELYDQLNSREAKNAHLLNIIDVLMQVYKKLDKSKDPVVLVNHMVNYCYVEGFGRILLTKSEEALLIELGTYGKKAGLNGRYLADFANKSQFYSIFKDMLQR
ncbi:bacteriocin immunity protein [Companilactobacillus furfuricola]|uniref:bacteriocin immunity protein n=1 Tax=Companilactobacillus furfuricola TaxID=1462575 RepID=UPI000F7AE2C6|nr:bacteriocin immunity protein [Companilactobacillus furfuricola]